MKIKAATFFNDEKVLLHQISTGERKSMETMRGRNP
jgi:hypothetical protein